MRRVRQRRDPRRLSDPANAEMVADAVKPRDQRRIPQRIAQPHPRQAVGLRERAEAQEVGAPVALRDARFGVGVEFAIGFVEQHDAVVGHRIDQPLHVGKGNPASHRIVRVRQIDEPRPRLARTGGERIDVLAVIRIGDRLQHAAEARDMVVECRIGPQRSDGHIAGGHEQPHCKAKQSVDPLAHEHPFRRDPVMRSQRGHQIMGGRVGIP